MFNLSTKNSVDNSTRYSPLLSLILVAPIIDSLIEGSFWLINIFPEIWQFEPLTIVSWQLCANAHVYTRENHNKITILAT